MTGERAFRGYSISKDGFLNLVDSLRGRFRVIGPARCGRGGSQTEFREIAHAGELYLQYQSTMIPPGKHMFYRPAQDILRFEANEGAFTVSDVAPEKAGKFMLIGVHSCDVYAILYLDRTFHADPYYTASRANTLIVALNCTSVDDFCFCSSVGTGPHLKADAGYDALLTDLGDSYLVEIKTPRAEAALAAGLKPAGDDEFKRKFEQESALIGKFKKHIDIRGLDGLLLENLDHPVWYSTADERCLSCTNCVMVCPTCFCHDIVDEVDMDMKTGRRFRVWDACQDMGFAEVHGGNFRGTRTARLRQFVSHKLNYTAQYGTVGTVGCGRCIRWCPTGIDLTEMAKEIQRRPHD